MQAQEVLKRKNYMLWLTMPIFAIQLMQTLVNNVDQLMISRWSQAAIGAVGNANQISWILMLLLTVLCRATVILVTQYKGAGDNEREKAIYVLSVAVNIIISVVIGAVCVFLGRYIFIMMNVSDPLMLKYATQYLAITGGTVLFTAMTTTYTAFLRSNAMVKETMYISIFVNVLNVIGNWLLIYGQGPLPELGVAGAAISTAISRAIGMFMLIVLFRRRVAPLDWRLLKPFPWQLLRKMLRIGVPAAGENFSYSVSQLVVLRYINAMGMVAINTKIYVALIVNVAYMFSNSLGEATQVAEGYMLGMRRHDDADRLVRRSAWLAVLITVALTALLRFGCEPILGLFISNDADALLVRDGIIALAKHILTIELVLEIGRSLNLVMVRALQGAGDIRFPVLMCIASTWAIAVALSWLFGVHLGWGLVGIWIAFAMDECLRGMVLYLRWRKGGWRKLDLVNDDAPAAQKA